MTETATSSMQEANTPELSVNVQDAASLQGIRRPKSILHVSQSLLSQHLQKDSKQHLSPLTFLYGRCRGLLCTRDLSGAVEYMLYVAEMELFAPAGLC